METGTMNVSQNFGIAAYQERMVVEVLTCANNLQSRCDMLEDATAILGCAACCAGIDSPHNESLLENTSQEDFSYSNVLMDSVGEQKYVGNLESSQLDSSSFPTPSAVDQELPSTSYAKRLRKRSAGLTEEDHLKKKRKVTHTESTGTSYSPSPVLEMGIRSSGQLRGDKVKLKTAKPKKGKHSLIAGKSAEQNLLCKESQPDEGFDVETAALEWHQCVSLLKSYGIIENPDRFNTEALLQRVPHPGYVGDGLLPKMCKICGMVEELNNTVICDDCQEAFHVSCCAPRMAPKYFKREDSWFCITCRKQKKKTGSKLSEKGSFQDDNSIKDSARNESKARLGRAHQADIPEWQNRADNDDVERCMVGCIGTEVPLSEEQKAAEKDHLLRTFNEKVQSLGWLPADKLPVGTSQNWVKCNNVVVRAHKDPEGRKHNEVFCGKWRRAPLNIVQADNWECFCAMEWDPLHADCAIPQECSNEDVLNRMSNRMPTNADGLAAAEAGSRKSTLRPGKFAL